MLSNKWTGNVEILHDEVPRISHCAAHLPELSLSPNLLPEKRYLGSFGDLSSAIVLDGTRGNIAENCTNPLLALCIETCLSNRMKTDVASKCGRNI